MINGWGLIWGVILGLGALLPSLGIGADRSLMRETRKDKAVEIAPGKWIAVTQIDISVDETLPAVRRMPSGPALTDLFESESTELIIPWKGKTVRWKGKDIPVSLREWEDNLYLVAFDRLGGGRLSYRAQDGDGFKEIKPCDYPKRIATQNLWLKATDYSIGAGGRKIYKVELAVNIDPEDPYFSHTLTARIWCELMTGKGYAETNRMADSQPLLREYAKKYDPIKLTAIIRTKSQDKSK